MTRCVLTAALTALVFAESAFAQVPSTDNDELVALRRQVARQQQRIAGLEARLTAAATEGTIGTFDDSAAVADSIWDKVLAKLDKMAPTSVSGWVWFVIGFGGEFIFFLRFVVQWWASERKKRTVVPMAFWHLSLIGTALVLAYALFRIDPVFILAYSLNIFLYVRNQMIARREPDRAVVMEQEAQ